MKKGKLIKALFNSMLFFAITHIVVASFLVISRLDLHYLNIFYISGINELIPNIDKGIWSFIVSLSIVLAVYAVFYAKQQKKN